MPRTLASPPFTDAEVRAILARDKTQFRVPITMEHRRECPWAFDENDNTGYEWVEADPDLSGRDYRHPCRCIKDPYQPGGLLWMRYCWRITPPYEDYMPLRVHCRADKSVQRIDPDSVQWEDWESLTDHWRSPMHMPRWAARPELLEVLAVRAEQVQRISEEDAIAEGCVSTAQLTEDGSDYLGLYARESFAMLWDRIYAKRGRGWAANPWVWATTFRLLNEPDKPENNHG